MNALLLLLVCVLIAGEPPQPPDEWLAATDGRKHPRGFVAWRLESLTDERATKVIQSQWTEN